MLYLNELVTFIASYLLGSILFAVHLPLLFGLSDPRAVGSGNPGASNVAREQGRLVGALVLVLDIAKGFLPIWITQLLDLPPLFSALAAIGAYLGHLFPVYCRFNGGKGMATLIGCLLAFDLLTASIVALVWGLLVKLFRYVSLASILASSIAPMLMWWTHQPESWTFAVALMALLTIAKHHQNIARLKAGTEVKIGRGSV